MSVWGTQHDAVQLTGCIHIIDVTPLPGQKPPVLAAAQRPPDVALFHMPLSDLGTLWNTVSSRLVAHSPITKTLSGSCGICAPISIVRGMRSTASRYSGKLSHSQF